MHTPAAGAHAPPAPALPSGPRFDGPVAPDGYAWWYFDAVSDDGRHALTVIAFVGSVFSPYYFAARRRGPADPREHCAINVALYALDGRGGCRTSWAMTERPAAALARGADTFALGPSRVAWDGRRFVIDVDERTVPFGGRLRGRITLTAPPLHGMRHALDGAARHHWQPLAPVARAQVALQSPELHWQGHAYVDCNAGSEPLEAGFRAWDWSRALLPDGSAAIVYDASARDGSRRTLALRLAADGSALPLELPPPTGLAPSVFRIARATHAAGGRARVLATLLDAPFYARSLIATEVAGARVTAMHESLSLDRFRTRWVQAMLPFRMPRRARPS